MLPLGWTTDHRTEHWEVIDPEDGKSAFDTGKAEQGPEGETSGVREPDSHPHQGNHCHSGGQGLQSRGTTGRGNKVSLPPFHLLIFYGFGGTRLN